MDGDDRRRQGDRHVPLDARTLVLDDKTGLLVRGDAAGRQALSRAALNSWDMAATVMDHSGSDSGRGARWGVTLLKFSLVAAVIVLLNIGVSWAIARIEMQIWPSHLEIVDRVVLAGVILYTILMAMPFVPGVELGVAFMMMLGSKGIVLIYVCTLIALAISFGIGRFFPTHLLASFLHWLHLTRAETLLRSFDATAPERRLEFLAGKASTRAVSALLKHRYLLLALLLNLPGNAVIGGGGGIAMMAGMCRLYSFPKYLLLIAVAILPGPLLVMVSNLIAR